MITGSCELLSAPSLPSRFSGAQVPSALTMLRKALIVGPAVGADAVLSLPFVVAVVLVSFLTRYSVPGWQRHMGSACTHMGC